MYRVELENKGEMFFTAKSKDYLFNIDLKGKGMTPPDAFLSALAGCMGVYFRKYLESTRLEIPEFKIIAEGEFRKEPPISFQKIKVSIDIRAVHLDEKRKSAVVEFIKNCPLHLTLRNPPEVKIEIF